MRNNKTEVLNSWTHIWDACVKMAIKFDWLLCRKLPDNMFQVFVAKKRWRKLVFVNRGLKRNWQLFLRLQVPNKQNLYSWRKTQSSLVIWEESWKKARIWHLQFDHNFNFFCYDKSSAIKTKRRQSMGKKKKQSMEMAIPENFATFFNKI